MKEKTEKANTVKNIGWFETELLQPSVVQQDSQKP